MAGVARLLHEVLPALRRERGLSQMALARRTARPHDEGLSLSTIQAYEKPGRAGTVPELEILEALAHGLEVKPEVFYEYPLALARRQARPGVSGRRAARPRSLRDAADEAARLRRDTTDAPREAGDGPAETGQVS